MFDKEFFQNGKSDYECWLEIIMATFKISKIEAAAIMLLTQIESVKEIK